MTRDSAAHISLGKTSHMVKPAINVVGKRQWSPLNSSDVVSDIPLQKNQVFLPLFFLLHNRSCLAWKWAAGLLFK